MAQKYVQSVESAETRFTKAPMDEVNFSRMYATPFELTTFNAGDIVPIRCFEVLPHDTYDMDLSFVIRQNTVQTPTMGELDVDFYAFFVPNRVVNKSWINVMGENTSGQWTAPAVSLVHLANEDKQIPVGSVADHYGLPTQRPMPAVLLQQMNDFRFRGYVEIYNQYFRDQNFQNPIPYSKLNIYNGFLDDDNAVVTTAIDAGQSSNGTEGAGAIQKAIGGDGSSSPLSFNVYTKKTSFDARGSLLKANKFHDAFTSVTPSPQRGNEVFLTASGQLPVVTGGRNRNITIEDYSGLSFQSSEDLTPSIYRNLAVMGESSDVNGDVTLIGTTTGDSTPARPIWLVPDNLYAVLDEHALLSVNEIRMSSAIQRVYETLARGGGRYRSFINSFFGLDTENPFEDIPTMLGHFRRRLDLYQTAQTSASIEGETPQGNLSAFGYTSNGGKLFTKTFLEHGYVHIFAVVRHRNVYSSYLSPDYFRLSQLDFYVPQLANISEQPIRSYIVNPFTPDLDGVFGYQEAWWEYRLEPNTVSGLMRPGVTGDLALWNYADDFDGLLVSADGEWLKSNTAEVVDRTLAVQSTQEPQFKGQFVFKVDKQRPLPTYSVPGADII